ATAQVPATLHGLLLARLDGLAAAERRVIQEAAVIGPRFEVPLLKAVSAEPGAVDAALDALAGADLGPRGPDHRFRHGLLEALEHCDAPAAATEIEAERLVARERMADLLGPIGRRAAALGEYDIVEAGHRAARDAPAQARVLRKMGGLHWDAGARARALQCFEAGLGLLGGDRAPIELAHVYQELGRPAF